MSPGESVLGFEDSCGRLGGLVTAVLLEALGDVFPTEPWARGGRSVMCGVHCRVTIVMLVAVKSKTQM